MSRRTNIFRRLGVLLVVLAFVAVACGDDDAETTTTAAFTPGALGYIEVAPGAPVEIRTLQAISGDVAFLGTDQVRGTVIPLF